MLNAAGGTRTHMSETQRILSAQRIPFRHCSGVSTITNQSAFEAASSGFFQVSSPGSGSVPYSNVS